MSNVRSNLEEHEGELNFPEEGDLRSFAIFTQKRDDLPHVFAGFVDATDAQMALAFGREHYGQDQECINMWTCLETAISGTDADRPPSNEPGRRRAFHVLTRKRPNDWHEDAVTVEASCSAEAISLARENVDFSEFSSIWVIADDALTKTGPDDLIWRHTSQDYRLARGYSKDVRDKWEKVRQVQDVDDYQRDDLKETF